ncbi:hypothetical protein BH10BAC2_BH10BAC2_19640 [soil metagenome]
MFKTVNEYFVTGFTIRVIACCVALLYKVYISINIPLNLASGFTVM